MTPLKIALSIAAALAVSLMLGTTAAAAAETPCWKEVINDWYDGRIDNVYPIHCYQEAIGHLPEDVQTYSSAKDEISRALLAAIRHDREDLGRFAAGSGGGSGPLALGPSGGEPPGGFLTGLIEKLGPSNAESVPLPLLVLAAIALLLLAAAGASFVARWVQARRVQIATAPARPRPEKP